ncbi:phosphoenolpyruvate--protein phosphotransferase [Paucilactobacillus hokkaidonensis JCM 18461]|uniref:Phosphoenolpyruvate-protein phosphotransferase n=2 Tax=Paucilactobacillus hokkaidonensis TaxID=1193095 RepID=A0A0A1GTE6_9LACO|nr:phosphoenolpyruvate--protein phosphotransferase [Paucilactobacillus hokkaidonensis]KRO07930.1 phosphoenolpyruvate--protein phosphotransferase [Paucilactobacillus hokkaidonensis]BAP85255.1 phosphoenolpyruvate--protein phosphotransferase [Paucilactobacillus hokkaidonensis JCM 18461]
MSKRLDGIAASNGIAIAKAYMLVDPDLSFDKQTVTDTEHEVKRLHASFDSSKKELEVIKQHAVKSLGAEEAEVFEAHITILTDPELIGGIEQKINDDHMSAESALKDVTDTYIGMFEAMTDNTYMQERAGDVRDVTKRVLSHLLGVKLPSPSLIDDQAIVVAHDLTPSDTAQLDRQFVRGFITDIGGRTSHSAIMSRTLEIPAVVGTENATSTIKDGDTIIVDGIHGKAIIKPSDSEIDEYQQMAAQFAKEQAEWGELKDSSTTSADGKHFDIAANVGTPDDLGAVLDNGGEAVGLFRSEFLYMNSAALPTEDEQFEAYKKVVAGMNGKQVVVRTMDIGGDKHLPYLPLPEEMNPFLGYRAIRISLDQQEIFRTQLRALLRASNYGKLAIMFPMIATVDEFKQARAIYDEEKQKMVNAGQPVADNIEVGMMMEIPGAVMIADKLAKYADFFSIGTNDLIQYTFAADRGNEHVSYLYQPYNPSLLRLIKRVIDTAHQEGKWAGMCGEMAGDQVAVPLLMGMGLDEFSMSATSMLQTRSLMKKLDTTKLTGLVDQALDAESNEEVIELVKKLGIK